ncbi:hypothetical protein [Spirosoma sp. KNUC1025]|uniref:hypothetical protein n=1 Tax=Spirosoma sp. KNUC1025 TaxID=2894082 RepID=UPI00386E47C9|nr:hypothetical protein LN737_17240 [Spirosoma sp. KNUC1025]
MLQIRAFERQAARPVTERFWLVGQFRLTRETPQLGSLASISGSRPIGQTLKMHLYYRPSGPTTKQKIVGLVCGLVVGLGCLGALFPLVVKHDEHERTTVKKNPVITKGTVVQLRSYKGKGADIEYFVAGKTYILKTGIRTEMYDTLQTGEEVDIAYFKNDPSMAVLAWELNAEYSLWGGLRATSSASRRKVGSPTE